MPAALQSYKGLPLYADNSKPSRDGADDCRLWSNVKINEKDERSLTSFSFLNDKLNKAFSVDSLEKILLKGLKIGRIRIV